MKEKIKKLCALKSISLNQLEAELGFGKGYISKLGKTIPSTEKIKKIADYFEVSIEYLLCSDDIEWNPQTQEMYRTPGIHITTSAGTSTVDMFPVTKGVVENPWYADEDTVKKAILIKNNQNLALLFDAAQDASPEDLEMVHAMLLVLKRKEQKND